MKLQIERLNNRMAKKSKDKIAQSRYRLETEWCMTGPIESAALIPYEKRFIRARNKLIESKPSTSRPAEHHET